MMALAFAVPSKVAVSDVTVSWRSMCAVAVGRTLNVLLSTETPRLNEPWCPLGYQRKLAPKSSPLESNSRSWS